MHYSLEGAGLGRTLVGCVLSVNPSGWVYSGSADNPSTCDLTGFLEPIYLNEDTQTIEVY